MTGVRTTLYGINSAQQKIKFGLVSSSLGAEQAETTLQN